MVVGVYLCWCGVPQTGTGVMVGCFAERMVMVGVAGDVRKFASAKDLNK